MSTSWGWWHTFNLWERPEPLSFNCSKIFKLSIFMKYYTYHLPPLASPAIIHKVAAFNLGFTTADDPLLADLINLHIVEYLGCINSFLLLLPHLLRHDQFLVNYILPYLNL
jgi:hypothetical protein